MLALTYTNQAAASPPGNGGRFGLGLIAGHPTGLTGKVWLSHDQAVDFHIAENHWGHRHGLGLYADYLFHFEVGNPRFAKIPIYLGPGLAIQTHNHDHHDVHHHHGRHDSSLWLVGRLPVGVAFLFKRFNGEAFAEASVNRAIASTGYLYIKSAAGFRWYF